MSGFLSLLARLFSVKPATAQPEAKPDRSAQHVDSNAGTAAWSAGKPIAGRDSIDSNPITARWYRKPRFVNQPAASHRTSLIAGGG